MLRASQSATTRASASSSSSRRSIILASAARHRTTLRSKPIVVAAAAPSSSAARPLPLLRRARRQAAERMAANASSSTPPTTKTVLVPVADGTEEMEAVVIVDVLRRAGAAVTVASVEQERLAVKCSRGVVLTADATLEAALGAIAPFDLIALPGGMPGAERLAASKPLADALRAQREAGRPFAAICAAPAVVLEAQGLLAPDQPATAHPAFSGKLANQASVSERVAVAVAAATEGGDTGKGSLVLTSRGPGTAFEFALALVAVLFGEEKAREVAGPMVMYGGWEESVGKAVAGAEAAAAATK